MYFHIIFINPHYFKLFNRTVYLMINKLCNVCARACKQSDSSKIVSCPKFLKNPSDREFRNMIDELDDAEKKVKNLQKNVREIIKNTLSENMPEQQDDEEPEGSGEPDENDEPDGNIEPQNSKGSDGSNESGGNTGLDGTSEPDGTKQSD